MLPTLSLGYLQHTGVRHETTQDVHVYARGKHLRTVTQDVDRTD